MGIEWTSKLEVGIPQIDKQHHDLCIWIGRLTDAFEDYAADDEVRRVLLFLNQYVTEHFQTEEGLMAQYSYPQMDAHKAKHVAFVGTFRGLIDEFKTNGATDKLARLTKQSVVEWLINHIGREDKALGAYLSGQMKG